jgi:hypothetical protein
MDVSYTMPWYICTRYCIHTYILLYTTSGSSGVGCMVVYGIVLLQGILYMHYML